MRNPIQWPPSSPRAQRPHVIPSSNPIPSTRVGLRGERREKKKKSQSPGKERTMLPCNNATPQRPAQPQAQARPSCQGLPPITFSSFSTFAPVLPSTLLYSICTKHRFPNSKKPLSARKHEHSRRDYRNSYIQARKHTYPPGDPCVGIGTGTPY
ncbi:hypothetical protein CMEL01_13322 [Colletotrichum melonis]|uniref:Uncharacterized protein n=1 Tax=Colletotrichum melonis TaxID=1209925 RepID=A0AAI9XTI5_9PEZI|nr:hypothetical protein CMEL01_13322 [Colletotrichum melonis]